MAHLAMFRRVFVEERRWIAGDRYDALVALAQLVPGPASSQVGFALGRQWAGWRGALAAFVGFTLPSAVLMTALGVGVAGLVDAAVGAAVLRGLMLVAIAVIVHAVATMLRGTRGQPALLAAAVAVGVAALLAPFSGAVWFALLLAAGLGALWPRAVRATLAPFEQGPVPTRWANVALGGVLLALALSAALVTAMPGVAPGFAVAIANLQAGALVFGGGHVVLPLLQAGTVERGLLAPEVFATGYGAAQALPGPMFAFAAYVGAAAQPGYWAVPSALLSLLVIFAPGFAFITAAQAHAHRWLSAARGLAALAMVNAGVIGLLAAAGWEVARTVRLEGIDLPAVLVALGLLLRHPRGAFWAALACVVYSVAVASMAG